MTRDFRQKNLTPREPRYPYGGRVRLLVDFSPWRLLLTLDGLNLSASGLGAVLGPSADKEGEARGLLAVGDPYLVQLEHDAEHLPAPVCRTRLTRRVEHAAGLELAFTFDEPAPELLGLIHELGQSCARPAT